MFCAESKKATPAEKCNRNIYRRRVEAKAEEREWKGLRWVYRFKSDSGEDVMVLSNRMCWPDSRKGRMRYEGQRTTNRCGPVGEEKGGRVVDISEEEAVHALCEG